MSKERKRERGSVIVLVTLTMVALIGFAALAVDGGYIYYRHTQLQDIDDAIALAAATEYQSTDSSTQDLAINKAKEYAEHNGLVITPGDGTHTAAFINSSGEQGFMDVKFNPDYIQVDLHLEPNLFFARVFNKTKASIPVSAKVAKGNMSTYGKELYPVGVEENENFEKDQIITLSCGPSEGTSGNYGFVNLDSFLPEGSTDTNNAGTTNFGDYLKTGYTGSTTFEVGGSINTITGEKVGTVDKALEDQAGKEIILPIINTFVDATGTERVTIVCFAKFELVAYDKATKIMTGKFIEYIGVGPTTGESSDFAAEGLSLIE